MTRRTNVRALPKLALVKGAATQRIMPNADVRQVVVHASDKFGKVTWISCMNFVS
jgi:hypothetical protein